LIDFIGPAEAVPLLQSIEESALQGVFPQPVKPGIDLIALIGPAEAVPLLQSLHLWSFVTACEALG